MGTHSGKFLVRLDPALHKQLSHEAEDCHVSLNEICIRKLAAPVFISTFASPFASAILLARKIFGKALIGIVIFGSYARGQTRESSDIDLMIILQPGFKYSRDHLRQWDDEGLVVASHTVSAAIVYLCKNEIPQNVLWLESAIEGIILLDTDQIVQRRLFHLRELIASGLVIKKISHGQSYWIRGKQHV